MTNLVNDYRVISYWWVMMRCRKRTIAASSKCRRPSFSVSAVTSVRSENPLSSAALKKASSFLPAVILERVSIYLTVFNVVKSEDTEDLFKCNLFIAVRCVWTSGSTWPCKPCGVHMACKTRRGRQDCSDILVLKLVLVLVFILFTSQNFYFI